MSLILIYLLIILLSLVLFAGLVCLQVHISKNDKRGKFVIPIVSFILPVVMVIVFCIGFFACNIAVSPDTTASSTESTAIIDTEDYDEIDDYDSIEGDDESVGSSLIFIPTVLTLMCVPLSIPCGITTLIIELVYRSKRNKKASPEEIIDIKNL